MSIVLFISFGTCLLFYLSPILSTRLHYILFIRPNIPHLSTDVNSILSPSTFSTSTSPHPSVALSCLSCLLCSLLCSILLSTLLSSLLSALPYSSLISPIFPALLFCQLARSLSETIRSQEQESSAKEFQQLRRWQREDEVTNESINIRCPHDYIYTSIRIYVYFLPTSSFCSHFQIKYQ